MSRTGNDNQKPPHGTAVELDEHRGMQAQRDTDERRQQSSVRADQHALRENQASLEKFLFSGPAIDWIQAAEKATYVLRLFAATGEAQDLRYQQMIEDTLQDLQRLTAETKEPKA